MSTLILSSEIKEKGLKTKTYGIIIVWEYLVHPFAIFSFQTMQKCREVNQMTKTISKL